MLLCPGVLREVRRVIATVISSADVGARGKQRSDEHCDNEGSATVGVPRKGPCRPMRWMTAIIERKL
jgi:hypothetical protein